MEWMDGQGAIHSIFVSDALCPERTSFGTRIFGVQL